MLLPLFERPFYRDWTVLLALLAIGGSTVTSLQSYGPIFQDGSGQNLEAALVDIAFVLVIQAFFFGCVPALIRRKLRQRRLLKGPLSRTPRPDLPFLLFVGLCVLVSVGTTAAVEASKDRSQARGSGLEYFERECRPQGDDTLCISGYSSGSTGLVVIESEWIYQAIQPVEGQSVRAFRWRTTLNCTAGTGEISDLAGYDRTGFLLPLSSALTSEMTQNMQRDQVPQLLEYC